MKRLFIIVLSIMMVFGSFTTTFAGKGTHLDGIDYIEDILRANYEDEYDRLLTLKETDTEKQLELLTTLGILKGTDKGLELEKGLTRAEGSIAYLRVNGKSEGIYHQYTMHFKDVPNWAANGIAYLYGEKIVNGITETEFGPNNSLTAEQFTTMILRGLGYDDKAGDFSWDKSLEKAVEIGLLSPTDKTTIETDKQFTRGEMSKIAYNTLFQKNVTGKATIYDAIAATNYGFSMLLTTELTDVEVIELRKLLENDKYEIFANDIEKREQLFSKVARLISRQTELFRIYFNGEPTEIDINSVNSMNFNNSIYSSFKSQIGVNATVTSKALGTREIYIILPWGLAGNNLKLTDDRSFTGKISLAIMNTIYPSDEYGTDLERNDMRGAKIAEEYGLEKTTDVYVTIYYKQGDLIDETIWIKNGYSLDYYVFTNIK